MLFLEDNASTEDYKKKYWIKIPTGEQINVPLGEDHIDYAIENASKMKLDSKIMQNANKKEALDHILLRGWVRAGVVRDSFFLQYNAPRKLLLTSMKAFFEKNSLYQKGYKEIVLDNVSKRSSDFKNVATVTSHVTMAFKDFSDALQNGNYAKIIEESNKPNLRSINEVLKEKENIFR